MLLRRVLLNKIWYVIFVIIIIWCEISTQSSNRKCKFGFFYCIFELNHIFLVLAQLSVITIADAPLKTINYGLSIGTNTYSIFFTLVELFISDSSTSIVKSMKCIYVKDGNIVSWVFFWVTARPCPKSWLGGRGICWHTPIGNCLFQIGILTHRKREKYDQHKSGVNIFMTNETVYY